MYDKHLVISAKTAKDRKETNMITLSYTGYHKCHSQYDFIMAQKYQPLNFF